METEARTCLNDILNAASLLNEFSFGKTYSDYRNEPLLRSATERQFGIIGDAMSRLAKVDEPTAIRITDYQQIISFRNVLIHEYDSVDNSVVWYILHHKLPTLVLEVHALLQEEDVP